MSISIEEFDEFFWRRGDLGVPFTDGERIDAAELAAYRTSQAETGAEHADRK